MFLHPMLENLMIAAEKSLGVDYSLTWDFTSGKEFPEAIKFSTFQKRWPNHRLSYTEKGNGGAALFALLRAADILGRQVVLWTDVPRLHSWYESFGFYRVPDHRENDWFRVYVYDPNSKTE